MDTLVIRDELNSLPFVQGKRRVQVGSISQRDGSLRLLVGTNSGDGGGEIPPERVSEYLDRLAAELARQDLTLIRGDAGIFAEQSLRHDTSRDLSWMKDAVNWASRVTTIALVMVVPGVLGMWLDRRWGTSFIALAGFVIGVALGIMYLQRLGAADKK